MKITTLFVDIGGVLLTNGWDHNARKLAAKTFNLDFDEMEERHRLIFDSVEIGKTTLDDYLTHAVFYKKRSFTPAQFRKFIFEQSQPYPEMIDLIKQLKAHYELKIVVVSNEAREINAYRIQTFKLTSFVDVFICSCFVHLRKPDADIFKLALDVAQTPVDQIIYIDDRVMFVEAAQDLGICGIHHIDYQSTRTQLASFGLKL